MQVFEFKTGKFTPLSADVLARFNPEQRAAYDELASAVAELNAANMEAEQRHRRQSCGAQLTLRDS